ncbi:MAG: SIR2 family protein [Gemmatimonadetes bacterium]|nr:SIR2 family protein [Gemmatimonadota bacterium]
MPELVAGGPTIPVRLLNELDGDKVVFFCGAGVSAGAVSGLPNFTDLVHHVYAKNHIEPDTVEKEALDSRALDKVLGLLERNGRLGARVLRQTVVERLSVPPTGELRVHKALIDLSRNERGFQLITTNFDNRFIEAGLDRELVDAAPKLPLPKPHNWSSLVHLHGRIGPSDDGANLVLTAADFGRAYLTERWAARFVTELFREFTVVFVGYSVSDPVMGYLVDALAAERALGARFASAYAFADCDGSDAGTSKARDGWRAKNVEPILYDKQDGHRLLTDTLIEWARLRTNPFHARSRIAINEMGKVPAGPGDPIVERVVWALEDPVAAKALADAPPVVDEDEFAKLGTWLDMFTEMRLLSCSTENIGFSGPDRSHTTIPLVDNGFRSQNPNNLDMTRVHLSVWLVRHLHVPQLLAWVLRNGGHLHPRLRQQIEGRLGAEDTNIPERLRLLWTALLANRPPDPWKGLWSSDRYKVATTCVERRLIEEEVIESIAPRLVVLPGPASGLVFRQYVDGKLPPISPIDACGHLKLVSGDDDSRRRGGEILQDNEVIARHAETLTGHLEQALDLGKHDDEFYPNSIFHRPSIAAHEQNYDHDAWTHLIDLARDSYLALAARQPKRAAALLLRWVESRQPLFRRLALHALAENPKSDIRLARDLLLKGRKPGLWEMEMHREVMRFFRLAGKRLPRSLRAEIVRAIHAGPGSNKGMGSFSSRERLHYAKALHLHKLNVSGASLDKRSRVLADEAAREADSGDDERDEFLLWHGEGRWIAAAHFARAELVEGSITDVMAAIEEEKIGQEGLRGLVARKRVKVASALRRLAKQDKWPASHWQGFLWNLAVPHEGKKLSARSYAYVATVLAEAPHALFNELGSAAAEFVTKLADECGVDREEEFGLLWSKAWNGMGEVEPQTAALKDPLTDALNHPAGKLAEAALDRMRKYEPAVGAGIPEVLRSYFDAVGKDPRGHLGRVMLATRLRYLFAVDPDWTAEHMIARLSLGQSQEAANLWSAYGWSASLSPDLLRAFKEAFLNFLRHDGVDNRRLANLRSLFIAICLDAPEELTEKEIRSVVELLPESGLKTVLRSLMRRLTGEAAQRAQAWRDQVHPWLRDYWPRATVRQTAGTTEAILAMLVECGAAFPEAVDWANKYLRPIEGRGLFMLNKSNHAAQYPDSMIQVLEQVIDGGILQGYEKPFLKEILDAIAAADTEIAGAPLFRKLYGIATQ